MLGNSVVCPICNSSFLFFLSGGKKNDVFKKYKVTGAGYRKNMQCPKCFTIDRSRLLYLYLNRYLKITSHKDIRVLHVSPKYEFTDFFLGLKNIEYHSIDLDPNEAMMVMDITDLSFANEYFDLIICNHVLEQVLDEKKAINEIYRVLKTSGEAIIQAPISLSLDKTLEIEELKPHLRKKTYGQSDMVRLYGQDYVTRFSNNGLRPMVVHQEEFLSKGEQIKFSLNQSESVYVFLK